MKNLGNGRATIFPKFFNYEELVALDTSLPDLPFRVYEKLDGSLGILYFYNGIPYIATRGSFDSAQAVHATKVLHESYKDILPLLDSSKTYLFEIIYKDNSSNLVVDYGSLDDIILLAVIDTSTGSEDDIENYASLFKLAPSYPSVTDFLAFRNEQNHSNREGFVVKYSNNFRVKLKFEEYFKAHSVKNHLNIKSVFDAIQRDTVDQLRSNIQASCSEETLIYFESLLSTLQQKYAEIEFICLSEYRDDHVSRKDAATYFMSCSYPKILFAMYDGKPISNIIWGIVKRGLAL